MTSPQRSLLVGLVTAALLLSGCLGAGGDSLSFLSDGEDATDGPTLEVELSATNTTDAIAHVALTPNRTLLHNASVDRPNGYIPVDTSGDQLDVVLSGEAQTVILANGSVDATTYDGVVLDLASLQAHGVGAMANANASEDANASDDAEQDRRNLSVTNEGLAVPLNLTFEVPEDAASTTIRLQLDVGASTEDGTLSPTFDVVIEQDGEMVLERAGLERAEDQTTIAGPQGPPPAARMTVFAPDGEKLHEPKFTVDQGIFINDNETAFEAGKPATFSGSESEAVAEGAVIDSYHWDFDDGTTATGATVSHTFQRQGVFEVTLTVEDTFGATAEHMLRMVAYRTVWTGQAVNASFEGENATGDEAAANWSTAEGDSNVLGTSWATDTAGHDSNTSWHVGTHQCHGNEDADAVIPCYGPGASATLTSPVIDLPSNWTSSGYSFYLAGSASSGSLSVEYEYGNFSEGNTTSETAADVDSLTTWTQFEDLDAFADAAGSEVQFTFSFSASSSENPSGPGFYMDDFQIGGVDMPTEKVSLLSQGST